MNLFFKEIFDYHHSINQKLIAQIKENNKIPEKATSLMSHVLNAHQIWNARILNLPTEGVFVEHSIDKCFEMDKMNYNNSIIILDTRTLDEIIAYKNTKGETFSNSIQDILYHIANHSSHHKGQIMALIRAQNITPIISDYIFYKR